MTRIMISRCNLDLQLFPTSSSSESTNLHSQSVTTWSSSRDQMTILHNIRPVYVCDPTELQAIGILLLARREMEEKFNFSRSNFTVPFMPIQLHGPSGLSLKRSLQRFLQKRRDRIQSAMPYKHAFL